MAPGLGVHYFPGHTDIAVRYRSKDPPIQLQGPHVLPLVVQQVCMMLQHRELHAVDGAQASSCIITSCTLLWSNIVLHKPLHIEKAGRRNLCDYEATQLGLCKATTPLANTMNSVFHHGLYTHF